VSRLDGKTAAARFPADGMESRRRVVNARKYARKRVKFPIGHLSHHDLPLNHAGYSMFPLGM
jgi:hypothetical protein